jgi:1,4-alpha-glucan branching enzyme
MPGDGILFPFQSRRRDVIGPADSSRHCIMVSVNRILIAVMAALFSGCLAGTAAPPRDGRDGVHFSFLAPGASSVVIAGTFNRWDREKHRLNGPGRDGVWTITIPLPPGRYEYLFVINGTAWARDPEAPYTDDGLGGANSVLIVPPD